MLIFFNIHFVKVISRKARNNFRTEGVTCNFNRDMSLACGATEDINQNSMQVVPEGDVPSFNHLRQARNDLYYN